MPWYTEITRLRVDIKVAIFDDMIEITSPGKSLPSIDFDELEARQS